MIVRRVSGSQAEGEASEAPVEGELLTERPGRIWLASYPRSGNSMLRQAFRFGLGLLSLAHYDESQHGVLRELAELDVGEIGARPGPTIVKTHDLSAADDPSPAIYIARDGRDAVVSYARLAMDQQPAARERGFERNVRGMLRREAGFGNWSQHVERWLDRPAPTVVVRYEDALADPVATALAALGMLGWAGEVIGTMPSFEESRRRDPVQFRKGRIGSWRDELPEDLEHLFWNLHGDAMARLGYPRAHPERPLHAHPDLGPGAVLVSAAGA